MKFLLPSLAAVIALSFMCLQFPRLDSRPMHHDEANQGIRFGDLLEGKGYAYDAQGHHGPTLYYATLPVAWLSGRQTIAACTESTLRLVPLAATVAIILLTGSQFHVLGAGTAIASAALFAISAPFTYYSTYYIQEPLLVLFSLGCLASAAAWRRTRQLKYLSLTCCCLGLAAATKETWLIHAFAMVVALFICCPESRSLKNWRHHADKKTVLAACLSFLVPTFLLYSSFLTHPKGLADAFKGLFEGASQSTQVIFSQPPSYFFRLLFWYHSAPGPTWTEWPLALLAILGIATAFVPRLQKPGESAFCLRFLSVYAAVQWLVYSLIPYKTPWCLLGFWAPTLILSGAGLWRLFTCKSRVALAISCILTAGLAWQQIRQTRHTCGRFNSDMRNPYVYSHTQKDLLNLVKRVREIIADQPLEDNSILVVTTSQDAWPLPWYFRDHRNIAFRTDWPDGFSPPNMPDFLIASPSSEVDLKTGDQYSWETHALRPNVFLFLGIRQKRWNHWLNHQNFSSKN